MMDELDFSLEAETIDGFTDSSSSLTKQSVRGEVFHVVYENEETGYAVFQVLDVKQNTLTAVGTIQGVTPGQNVLLKGKWEVHKVHGKQFRFDEYTYTLPSTEEGLIRYLSSGLIKGMGEKMARLIVSRFGMETIDILNDSSNRLLTIPGIGKKTLGKIRSSWKENQQHREVQIYLQGLGINPVWFNRIYREFGENTVAMIQEDPYCLATHVRGIGFVFADRVARSLGIGKNDERRLVPGVAYALHQIKISGHVCMPILEFLKYLEELLELTEKEAENALSLAEEKKQAVIAVSISGDTMVYEPAMFRCENEFPQLLRKLLTNQNHACRHISQIPPKKDSKFSKEQLDAVQQVAVSPVSIITGGPGVGKTTVVSEIVRRASDVCKKKVVLVAPTGRAAKRLKETTHYSKAYTIHRLLEWKPSCNGFEHGVDNPLSYDLFVIDESSMLDITLAVALFRAIPSGSTVVIVGDPDQLPSVGPGNVLNDLIDSEICPVSRLTKIFRQGNGSGIIHAAHDVNHGVMPIISPKGSKKQEFSDFYWIEKDDDEAVADIVRRLITDRIPKRFNFNPINDIQLLCPMNRGTLGTQNMNEQLQSILNPDSSISFKTAGRLFKVGDKVMQIVNNYEKGVFNGDMGFVVDYCQEEHSFTVEYDGSNRITYEMEEGDQLVLAYAITIHKSQGSEFPAVVMPLMPQHYMMLQRNLLYTGMTRAKQLMILVASRKAVSMAVRNMVREKRYSLLKEKLIYGGNA